MRFLVPSRERIADDADQRAYMVGMDEIPWQTRSQWTEEGLLVRRAESDSGNFVVPWRVPGYGEFMLTTGSLIERERAYHLPVELARGTINRVRNQLAALQNGGVTVEPDAEARLGEALTALARAATLQHEPAAAAPKADEALVAAFDAMHKLSDAYTQQLLHARRRQAAPVLTLLGINLGSSLLKEHVQKEIKATFNAATVPLIWRHIEAREGKHDWALSDRQVEWCRTYGMKICAGPLLELDRWSLPDWLYLWEGDTDALLTYFVGHIRAVVERYRGRVHVWNCAARLNVNNTLSLGEEQRLRLAAIAVETVRDADPRTPVVISIDQPWGEFMSRQETDLSPIHFADALVRGELGLAGLLLELNVGYCPDGTSPRDVLDVNRQLDRWSALGLPLLVSLTVPSNAAKDPRAHLATHALPCSPDDEASTEWQRQWAAQYLPLLLAKPLVQGVVWNQLLDSKPHDYPHGGLFDMQDQPKAALAVIQQLRQDYL